MKYFSFLIFLLFWGTTAMAQVGVHTDFPDNSSAMEIYATDRGLLIPRVTLTSSLSNPSPVTAPAVGLLVFNSGANQAIGFYYWNGSTWVLVGGGSSGGSYWSLTGNAGTVPGTDFVGTTDANHFLVYTNNTERLRFEDDGQVIVGGTTPNNSTDLFTVFGNSTQNSAISVYSPRSGFTTNGGRYGILATVDTVNGYAYYGRNLDPLGYGIISVGSGITSIGIISTHTAGISTYGYDGLHAWGKNVDGYGIFAMGSNATGPFNISGRSAGVASVGSDGMHARGSNASGRGIIAVGSGLVAPSTSLESEGGAFLGYHGIFSKGANANGIGVIGVGSNISSYSTIAGGVGGSFSGNFGAYGKGLAAEGVGILGVGSNGAGYYTVTGGSGGAFTGYHGLLSVGVNTTAGIGVIGAGNDGTYNLIPSGAGGCFTGVNNGAVGFGTNASSGIGVIGAGNNQAAWVPSNGCGGAFTGNTGVFVRSSSTTGTGLVAIGNNLGSAGTYANGAGGTLTGTEAGVIGWGTSTATGIGVIGSGNNATISTPTVGSGGAFTGYECGVYGYSTLNDNESYGGYFANAAGSYAYVGYRKSNKDYKILGTGLVSTIVKNTEGELITMFCPEAPEVVFQDYGTGQLVNGFAHISIDPDLAININVDESHPLKVYITPEGDCNGVYVTNKSATGFDVIELQGGQSNVPFSWQIVATRANEQHVMRDGTIQISDYSGRFDPAPGPLESIEQVNQLNKINTIEINPIAIESFDKETYSADHTSEQKSIKVETDSIIKAVDNPDE